MKIHLVDGTYELFRAYFALPSIAAPDGREVGAVRGLILTMLSLLRQDDVTHVACAFDHVVESFRNDLFDGYKTGSGVPEELMSQFELAERATSSLGVVVWPMTEFEADDALATAAVRWSGLKKPRWIGNKGLPIWVSPHGYLKNRPVRLFAVGEGKSPSGC